MRVNVVCVLYMAPKVTGFTKFWGLRIKIESSSNYQSVITHAHTRTRIYKNEEGGWREIPSPP